MTEKLYKIEDVVSNVDVMFIDKSIKRAKYAKSVDVDKCNSDLTAGINALARAETGQGHDNFLSGIVVDFDLTFSIKAWTEAERYHFFQIITSQSTMHKMAHFDLRDPRVYVPYTDQRIIDIMIEKVDEYNKLADTTPVNDKEGIAVLARKYKELLYSNPTGFRLTAGISTNYLQLKTIYQQRKTHRLTDEWGVFCDWIETLPRFVELTQGADEANEQE